MQGKFHKSEYIERSHEDQRFLFQPAEKKSLAHYPWNPSSSSRHPIITKEAFRCRGSFIHPRRMTEEGERLCLTDCGGAESHSLPLKNGQEHIYPILITLLNYLQDKTGHRVIITSGHRCLQHNTYIDVAGKEKSSKHMIGAEVSFYIEGMEQDPQKVVDLLIGYYQEERDLPSDYRLFHRYEKEDTNVSTLPWYNKEIFIKLFKKHEGRHADNQHSYPYLSIQVRYDRDERKRVSYSWDQAFYGIYRY